MPRAVVFRTGDNGRRQCGRLVWPELAFAWLVVVVPWARVGWGRVDLIACVGASKVWACVSAV